MVKLTNLDDLLLFVTLVEAGSFTLAAEKLQTAKSKLSRRLVQLEKNLGCELLLRTTRKQQLTESGRILYCACKSHIEALSKIEEELSSAIHQPQGKLNILLPLEFFNKVISGLIAEFLKLYPKIQLNCQHYSGAVPEFDPQFDLCFVLHEQQLPSSNWIAKQLLSFPQSIYFSPNLADGLAKKLENKKRVNPEYLTEQACILAQDNQPWLFRQNENTQAVYVKGRVTVSSPEMRMQACQQNLGFTKLPDYVLRNSQYELLLQRLSLSHQPVAQRLTVLYQSRNIAAKTRAFLDYFQSNIGKLL